MADKTKIELARECTAKACEAWDSRMDVHSKNAWLSEIRDGLRDGDPAVQSALAMYDAMQAEVGRLKLALWENQSLLEAIDRNKSTSFTGVARRIVTNRNILRGEA